MEPGRQRAEAWLADCGAARREADRKAQQPPQLGAGAEIAARGGRGCQPEAIAAQEGSGAARACACACPWQPIETAPRDGARLLLLIVRGGPRVELGSWDRDLRTGIRPRPYWSYSARCSSDRACPPIGWLPLPGTLGWLSLLEQRS